MLKSLGRVVGLELGLGLVYFLLFLCFSSIINYIILCRVSCLGKRGTKVRTGWSSSELKDLEWQYAKFVLVPTHYPQPTTKLSLQRELQRGLHTGL